MRICCEWPNLSDDIAAECRMRFGRAEHEVPLKYNITYKTESTTEFACRSEL